MTGNPRIRILMILAFLLALASIVVTRVLKAFTVAEVLAVAAFLCGLGILLLHRRQVEGGPLPLPARIAVTASLVGLLGLPLKLLFTLLGIDAAEHDAASHAATPGNPLLVHIHHVFFNLGFLILLVAALAWLVTAFRRPR